MNRLHEAKQALEKGGFMEEMAKWPKHLEVRCNECGWIDHFLTNAEMETAIEIHKEHVGCADIQYCSVLGIREDLYKLKD